MFNNAFKKKKNYVTIQENKTSNNVNSDELKVVEKCPNCKSIIFKKELSKNLNVCPNCNHHFAINSDQRILALFDEGSFDEIDKDMSSVDPLNFPTYQDKINSDINKTSMNDAILAGIGKIDNFKTVIAVIDSRFRMGSMGSVVGEKITRAIELSIAEKCPFLLFSASGGARMQEGVLSLMQMAKTSAALEQLDREGLLFISIMTNPTTGGVSASFASLGDINIAEPGALIGFAGRRIIEQTIHEKLPDDFQTAEFLLKHGQLDLIVNRLNMQDTFSKLFALHGITKEES